MCAPSTSASVRKIILSYLDSSPLYSAFIPVPIALMRELISSFWSALFSVTFWTLIIFPRIGRIACVLDSRACLAGPAAESPSTMNNSLSEGSFDEQSASLPGSPAVSRILFLLVSSLAFFALILALAAKAHLSTIALPSFVFLESHFGNSWLTNTWTLDFISVFPNLVFVWPSNWGSWTLTEITPVKPSLISSPVSEISECRFLDFAKSLIALVTAVLSPSSCVPPSKVWMLFAKLLIVTSSSAFHCIATSISESFALSEKEMIFSCKTSWPSFK